MQTFQISAILLLAGTAQVQSQFLSQLTDAASAFTTKYLSDRNELGEYSYEVETSDGLFRGERRTVLNPGTDQETAIVEGYYSYLGPDGQRYTVGYRSDENGFQPEGEHLPPAANVKRRPPQVGVPVDKKEIGDPALRSLQGQTFG